MVHKIIRFLLSPYKVILKAWRQVPVGSFKLRLDFDIMPRPHYAYCVYEAARLADALKIDRISVIEFGVAGGNGLAELERVAAEIEKLFRVRIDVYGFDNGTGLPKPVDYRDVPYVWKAGFFKMDVDALRRRLRRAKLVLGDVSETAERFFQDHSPPPIGAVFIDLDFYSSTKDALKIFDGEKVDVLPRVFCYFDDVISSEDTFFSDRVGELLAIEEYNAANATRQLAKIAGFPHTRAIPAQWNDQIYVHHWFDHPNYNTYIYQGSNRQLPLK